MSESIKATGECNCLCNRCKDEVSWLHHYTLNGFIYCKSCYTLTYNDFTEKNSESINHPSHYKGRKFEAIDIIEDYGLNFCEGNALKYLLRYKQKNGIEDLKKCIWYVKRIIDEKENKSRE